MAKLTHGLYPLLGVLLLAALLRVWGLTWGLPSATHYFSYHPDESVVLQVAMFNMNLFKGQMLPHFYDYPSLQITLVNIANSTAYLFGAVDIVPKDPAAWYPQWARMYLIGRCLTVAMGVGTVWATYALGTRLWGRRAGILAALTLALIPLHAQHSHWLTVDVPATFWVMLSLVWTARLAMGSGRGDPAPTGEALSGVGAGSPRPFFAPLRTVLWAGVFAGLAAATKYNMALVLLPLVTVCLFPSLTGRGGEPPASRGGSVFLGLLAAVVAFLLACPGAVLESHKFLAGLRFEAVHVSNTDDPTFKDTGSGFVFHITHNLSAGLGLPLLLLSLISIAYALYRRERGDGLLAVFALPYYILISLAAVRYARYVIPLLPILALWCGRLQADLSRLPNLVRRRSSIAAGAIVLLLTLGDCLWIISPMAGIDPRDDAMQQLNRSKVLPTVGFPVQPWFGTVPISPYFSAPKPGAWRALTPPTTLDKIICSDHDWDLTLLKKAKPTYIILSEYDYRDTLRLHDPTVLAYLKTLRQDFVLSDDSPRPLSLWSLPFLRFEDGLPVHDLPHDMLYANPEILIYKRKP